MRLTGKYTVSPSREALIGNGADAACGVAGIEVDQLVGAHAGVGVVVGVQFGRKQFGRPGVVA